MGLIRVVITRIVEDVAAALALVAAGVLLLAQGGRFSDRLDIITHFSPLFLVLAILAALLGAMTPATRLRRFTLATSAAGLVLAGLLVLPEMLRDIRPFADPAPAGDELKIIQINSWSGRNETLEDTADWLVSQDPDIIVAQESNRRFQSALDRKSTRLNSSHH